MAEELTEITAEKLSQMYSGELLSIRQIAEHFACSEMAIHRRLRVYGIPSRPKSSRKIQIPEEELITLYCENKRSLRQIAEIYACSLGTIHTRIHALGIPMRNSAAMSRLDISESELRELYVTQKRSARQIAESYGCSLATVLRRLHTFGIPLRRQSEASLVHHGTFNQLRDFDGGKQLQAYMIGLRAGDLSARKEHKHSTVISVRCSSTRPEQIEMIRELFAPHGHILVTPYLRKDGRIAQHIQCSLNPSFGFLLEKPSRVPHWILADIPFFIAFFAGFVDAEGSFYLSKAKNRRPTGWFKLGVNNKPMLEECRERLIAMGIRCSIISLDRRAGARNRFGITTRKDSWAFKVVAMDSLLKLHSLLSPYLRHPKRRQDMNAVKANVEARKWQRVPRT